MRDSKRKWMYWFLALLPVLQLYFVRELAAAFLLFTLGFAVLALIGISLYMIQKIWERCVL